VCEEMLKRRSMRSGGISGTGQGGGMEEAEKEWTAGKQAADWGGAQRGILGTKENAGTGVISPRHRQEDTSLGTRLPPGTDRDIS